MPTLLVEISGRRMIAELSRRVIIGRVAGSDVRVSDRAVSRIHAWIAQDGETYYINDAGSRFGSRINGQLFHGRIELKDGDQIRIGPARLRFREKMSIPPGFEKIDLDETASQRAEDLIDCACGAPLWTPWDYAGQVGQCRYCGNKIDGTPVSPKGEDAMNATMVMPAINPAASKGTCGACHSDITLGESTTVCPDCGVTFHANCWVENLGCSSYGCKQVGLLDPARSEPQSTLFDAPQADDPQLETLVPASTGRSVDWSYPMLAAALGSALLGLLAFGIPPAICLIGIVVYRFKARERLQHGLFVASASIALVATGAGAAFSWYWWLAGRTGTKVALL